MIANQIPWLPLASEGLAGTVEAEIVWPIQLGIIEANNHPPQAIGSVLYGSDVRTGSRTTKLRLSSVRLNPGKGKEM